MFVIGIILISSCEKNHKYGLVAVNDFVNEYQEYINKINSQKLVTLPNDSCFDPMKYDLGKVFNNYHEVEKYLYGIYNESSNYNNDIVFYNAKKTKCFICIDINKVERTFLLKENDKIELVGISNVFNFNDLYPNYYQNTSIMKIITNDLGSIQSQKMDVFFEINNKIYKGIVWSSRGETLYLDELIYIKEKS